MSDIYFKKDEIGFIEYSKHKKSFRQIFETEYEKLKWDPKDPKYKALTEDMINCHNNEVKRILKEKIWKECIT